MTGKMRRYATSLVAASLAYVGCGKMMVDPCKDVMCQAGQTCNSATGLCEGTPDLCARVTCTNGQSCDPADGVCKTPDKCKNVNCINGQACDPADGVCKTPPVAPSLSSISPVMGSTMGGTMVSIKGMFFKGATVKLGTQEVANPTVDASFATITFAAPANLGKPGLVDVVVKNADNLTATATGGFRYFLDNFDATASAPAWAYAPRWIMLRDLNADTKLDLITVNANNNNAMGSFTRSVSVALGKGDGTFEARKDYPVGNTDAAGYPFMGATADVDGDGKLDFMTVNQKDRSLSFLPGNGDGTFKAAVTQAANTLPSADPQGIVIADFNKDGMLDFVVANNGNGTGTTLTVIKGNKTFTPMAGTNTTVAAGPYSLITADFNKDTYPDVAVAHNNGTVSVLINNADGNATFKTPLTITSGIGATTYAIVSADLNNDNNPDIAVSGGNTGQVRVITGKGDGTFNTVSGALSVGGQPQWLVAEDINGDTYLDLITANFSSGSISVLKGDGTGKFSASTPASVSTGQSTAPNGVALGDLDGDGRMDLVTTNYKLAAGATAGALGLLLSTAK